MVEEASVELPTGTIRFLAGGSGPQAIVLHHDHEGPNWGEFHQRLAETCHVVAPDMPGWGESTRLEWARHPRDLAAVMLAFGRQLGTRPYALVGLGFGGWVAAEMASFAPDQLRHLVLVGAAGLKPDTSHILDQMMMDHRDYVTAGFADPAGFANVYGEPSREQQARWEASREVIARICWKPYMYSYELPETLKAMTTPTTLIWGAQDSVVPPRCAELYAEVMPNASIEMIGGGGHFLDLERPVELASLVATSCKE